MRGIPRLELPQTLGTTENREVRGFAETPLRPPGRKETDGYKGQAEAVGRRRELRHTPAFRGLSAFNERRL